MVQPVAQRHGLTVQQVQGLMREPPVMAALESLWNQSCQAELDGRVLQPGDDFTPFWEQRVLQYNAGGGGGSAQVIYRISDSVQINNNWIWRYTHTISIFLILAFIFLVWIMRRAILMTTLAGAPAARHTWTPTANVLKNNLLLIFPAILIAEGGFFELVAKKYIPVLPSQFVRTFSQVIVDRACGSAASPHECKRYALTSPEH